MPRGETRPQPQQEKPQEGAVFSSFFKEAGLKQANKQEKTRGDRLADALGKENKKRTKQEQELVSAYNSAREEAMDEEAERISSKMLGDEIFVQELELAMADARNASEKDDYGYNYVMPERLTPEELLAAADRMIGAPVEGIKTSDVIEGVEEIKEEDVVSYEEMSAADFRKTIGEIITDPSIEMAIKKEEVKSAVDSLKGRISRVREEAKKEGREFSLTDQQEAAAKASLDAFDLGSKINELLKDRSLSQRDVVDLVDMRMKVFQKGTEYFSLTRKIGLHKEAENLEKIIVQERPEELKRNIKDFSEKVEIKQNIYKQVAKEKPENQIKAAAETIREEVILARRRAKEALAKGDSENYQENILLANELEANYYSVMNEDARSKYEKARESSNQKEMKAIEHEVDSRLVYLFAKAGQEFHKLTWEVSQVKDYDGKKELLTKAEKALGQVLDCVKADFDTPLNDKLLYVVERRRDVLVNKIADLQIEKFDLTLKEQSRAKTLAEFGDIPDAFSDVIEIDEWERMKKEGLKPGAEVREKISVEENLRIREELEGTPEQEGLFHQGQVLKNEINQSERIRDDILKVLGSVGYNDAHARGFWGRRLYNEIRIVKGIRAGQKLDEKNNFADENLKKSVNNLIEKGILDAYGLDTVRYGKAIADKMHEEQTMTVEILKNYLNDYNNRVNERMKKFEGIREQFDKRVRKLLLAGEEWRGNMLSLD